MKFRNEGSALTIKWNAKDFDIPVGEFNVENEGLGRFIVKKALQWKLNIIDATAPIVAPRIEPIVAEVVKEEVKEPEIKEAVVTEELVEPVIEEKTKSKLKKSKELENSL
jgi:hypothetical protein